MNEEPMITYEVLHHIIIENIASILINKIVLYVECNNIGFNATHEDDRFTIMFDTEREAKAFQNYVENILNEKV